VGCIAKLVRHRRHRAYPALTNVFSIDLDRGRKTDDFRAAIHRTVLAEVTPTKFVGTKPKRIRDEPWTNPERKRDNRDENAQAISSQVKLVAREESGPWTRGIS
jgi:hypothetical protein